MATVEDLDYTLAVNTRGVFLCYKYAAKQMVAQGGGGKLIAISSIAGTRGIAAYDSLKTL